MRYQKWNQLLLFTLLFVAGSIGGLAAIPLGGSYSVGGAGADFGSLQAALTQLNSEGQSALVSLNLNAGTYDGAFEISRPIASFDLVITAVGDAEVILTNSLASADANYILKIDNSSRIIISHLKFMPSGTYSRSIVVNGNSDQLTFQNNVFVNGSATTSWNNEAISFFADGSNDADEIRFELNSFQQGGCHISVNASNTNTHYSDWSFWANAHTGGTQAIYLKQTDDISISGELIDDAGSAITLEQCSGSLELQRCNVYAKTYGITIINSSFTPSATPQIYNNRVKLSGTNIYNPAYDSDAYGLVINANHVYLAYNTVDNMSRTTASTALSLSGSDLIARNNLLVASGQGIALYLYSAGIATLEHNNFYSSYTKLVRVNNSYYFSLQDCAAALGGTNYSVNPLLDNQLKTISPRLDNLGLPCGITSDYNNLPRDANTPDIGAHEFSSDPALVPLTGTVTVGDDQDYETLTDLATALTLRGIGSNLTIALCDSLYEEQFQLDAISGSEQYHITFQPQGRTGTVIRYSNQSSQANYLIHFLRTANLTFQDISFETLATSYNNMLFFEGYNLNPRFLYCEFNAPLGAAGFSILTPYGSLTPQLDVLACNFYGNGTGVYHTGDVCTMGSNVFTYMGNGVSLNQSNYSTVSGNGFYDCTGTSVQVNTAKGLQLLRNTSIGSATGIYLSNLELDGVQRNLIANNAVKVTGGNMRYGISMGGNGINLVNNTFQVTGTNSFGLYSYQPGPDLDIVNNIFSSDQAHAVEFTYYTPAVNRMIDYNCYYSPTNYLARFGSYFTSLADLQAAFPEQDQHSVSLNPMLTQDMHTQSPWLRQVGIYRDDISTDMDNDPRGMLFDIGADQQTGIYDFTPLSGTYTIGSQGDYPTLQAFFNELSLLGASSSITACLLPGMHSGSLLISDFPRMSSEHYLTISGQPGAQIILNPVPNGEANYAFKLAGVDRVIFENLSLNATNYQNQSYYLLLSGKCDEIKVTNCSFTLGDSYNFGISASGSINNGLIVENCQFTGGDRAIFLQGSGYTSDLYQNVRLENNSFSGCRYPVEISRATDVKLLKNTMSSFTTAIIMSYIYGNSDLARNRFSTHNQAGSFSSNTMVSLDNLIGTQDTEIELLDNIVYSANNQLQALTGIYLSNSTNVRLYHNTISVENTYSFDYGSAYSQANCSHISQVNNIFASVHRGYAVVAANCSENYFSHNAYYSGGKQMLSMNSVLYEPLAGISALGDAAGLFVHPYVDATGCTTSNYLGNKGASSYVQTDIDSQVWGSDIPIGASNVAYLEPLASSIIIGSSFPDLASTINAAMKRGIVANTEVFLPAGTHNVSCVIGYIPNTLQNTFSILSTEGAVLTNNATGDEANYILKLSNVRNLNLSNLWFEPLNGEYARCVVFSGYNCNVQIYGCSFNAPSANSSSINSTAIYAADELYDNILVSSCQVSDFAYGAYISASYASAIANGLEIMNNAISNSYCAISVQYSNAANIHDNLISTYRGQGINLSYGKGDLQLMRNRISGSGSYALLLIQHSDGSPVIANNYLVNNSITGNSTFFLESTNTCKVYFNTMINASSYSNSSAFYQSGGVSQLQFINNICRAASGSGAVLQTPAMLASLDHNLFYSSLGNHMLLAGTAINGLAQWTAATGDASCIFANPLLDGDSYNLLPASSAINAGTALAGFEYDLHGRLRTLPDLGCREYSSAWLIAPTNLQIGYEPATHELLLSWNEVSGATSYLLYSADNPAMLNATEVTVSGTSKRVPASPAHRFFRVTAVNLE